MIFARLREGEMLVLEGGVLSVRNSSVEWTACGGTADFPENLYVKKDEDGSVSIGMIPEGVLVVFDSVML